MNVFYRSMLFGIFLLGLSFTAFSQTGWWPLSSGTTYDLEGIFSASATHSIVVGKNGTILGSTTGGSSWLPLTSGTNERLRKVFIAGLANPIIYVVGDNGTLLKSTTGGLTFDPLVTGLNFDFHDVFSPDMNFGNIASIVGESGVILRTVDAGTSFSFQLSPSPENLNGVFFTTAFDGVAVGDNGTIIRTTNSGMVWNLVQSGTNSDLHHVFFTSLNDGIAVGDSGRILVSTNSGQNWQAVASPDTTTLRRLFFTDQSTGTAVGDDGCILRSTDGGATWHAQSSGTQNTIRSVFFTDSDNGIAVGDLGLALKTIDGGVPVELTYFGAQALDNGRIRLRWSTAGESSNFGFHIERASDAGWITVGFVHGHGDTRSARNYDFTDSPPGGLPLLRYRLKQMDFDGSATYSPEIAVNAVLPSELSLRVSPHPVTDVAHIHIVLDNDTPVTLDVYDMTGRRISKVFDGQLLAGAYVFSWRRGDHPAGVVMALLRMGHRMYSEMILLW